MQSAEAAQRDLYDRRLNDYRQGVTPAKWHLIPYRRDDMLAKVLPDLAQLLGWTSAESAGFRNGLTIAPEDSVSPATLLLAVVAHARAFQEALVTVPAPPNPVSNLVLAALTLISGPVWIGMVAGILVAMAETKPDVALNDADLFAAVQQLIPAALPTGLL